METALSDAAKSADSDPFVSNDPERFDGISELQRQEALLKTGALQDAILNSANFSSIATDEKGVKIGRAHV